MSYYWLTTHPDVILLTDHSPWCHITDWPLPLVSYYWLTTHPDVILLTDHSPRCHVTDWPLPQMSCYTNPVFFMINSKWTCLYPLNSNKMIKKWSEICGGLSFQQCKCFIFSLHMLTAGCNTQSATRWVVSRWPPIYSYEMVYAAIPTVATTPKWHEHIHGDMIKIFLCVHL